MNIVNLCCYGNGHYSGAEYEENIAISEEAYQRIKDVVEDNEYKVYLGELDGKHSEVYGTIEVQPFKESELIEAGFGEGNQNDGDHFYVSLKDRVSNLGVDIDKDIKLVKDYFDSLDLYEEITVKVKRSNKQKLLKYIEESL